MWSDEKIFAVEAVTNTQNGRLYARDAGDLPEGGSSSSHLRRMKQFGVMLWAAVASDGSKSPSVIIDRGGCQGEHASLHQNVGRKSVTESFGSHCVVT